MAKNVVFRINRNLARRLREARQELGLSLQAVAAALPKSVAVSHVTISSYEKGTTTPPVDVLAALALIYKRPLSWFLEDRDALEGIRYRNLKSRVSNPDKRQFEAVAAKWIDAYVSLESHLGRKLTRKVELKCTDQGAHPAALAMELRKELELEESAPIQNMVAVLEHCGVRVLEQRTSLRIDGLAARHADAFVVVLNPGASNDRLRMNAAHELAHVLFNDCKQGFGWSDTFVERRAYEFASVLLLPESQLRKAVEGRSFLKLLQFKERFGISLAAMIYRAEKRRLIPSSMARRLWKEMSRRGWRKTEPGYVWRDRAIRFETLLESAVQSGNLTWGEAAKITDVSVQELQNRISEATEYGSAPRAEEGGETDDETMILRVTSDSEFDDP